MEIASSKDLPKKDYDVIHMWIRRKFGRANRCDNPTCSRISKRFDWSLLHGKTYERKISNYWQLCRSCHLKYDCTEKRRADISKKMTDIWSSQERRDKMRALRTGTKHTEESRRKMSIKQSGENNAMYGVRFFGEQNHFFGKHHKESSKRLVFEKQAKLSREQVSVLRKAASYGAKQVDLANVFGISKPSVCRIVKNKRYTL